MTKESFYTYANITDVFQAVTLAKYFGVGLNTVKLWVASYINERK